MAPRIGFFCFFCFFIFGCVGSSLLRAGPLQLQRAGATPRRGAQASRCGGFSCCRARALGARASAAVALWLAGSVVVTRGLQSTGSAIAAHGPSCSAAHGILLDQGSNPRLLHRQADSQPLHHQGSPTDWVLMEDTWAHFTVNRFLHLLRQKSLGLSVNTLALLTLPECWGPCQPIWGRTGNNVPT